MQAQMQTYFFSFCKYTSRQHVCRCLFNSMVSNARQTKFLFSRVKSRAHSGVYMCFVCLSIFLSLCSISLYLLFCLSSLLPCSKNVRCISICIADVFLYILMLFSEQEARQDRHFHIQSAGDWRPQEDQNRT